MGLVIGSDGGQNQVELKVLVIILSLRAAGSNSKQRRKVAMCIVIDRLYLYVHLYECIVACNNQACIFVSLYLRGSQARVHACAFI